MPDKCELSVPHQQFHCTSVTCSCLQVQLRDHGCCAVVLQQHELRVPLACLLGWFAESASCLSVGICAEAVHGDATVRPCLSCNKGSAMPDCLLKRQ